MEVPVGHPGGMAPYYPLVLALVLVLDTVTKKPNELISQNKNKTVDVLINYYYYY